MRPSPDFFPRRLVSLLALLVLAMAPVHSLGAQGLVSTSDPMLLDKADSLATPAIAFGADERALVVYKTPAQQGTQVWARLTTDGGAAVGAPVLLGDALLSGVPEPVSVAALVSGGYVVVWKTAPFFGAVSDSIEVRHVSADGALLGAPETVEIEANGIFTPKVAALPDGGWLVAWGMRDATSPTSERGVAVRRYRDNGMLFDPTEPFTFRPASSTSVDLDVNADGRAVLAWSGPPTTDSLRRVEALILTPAYLPTGEAIEVSRLPDSGPYSDVQVAVGTDGGFLVIWHDTNDDAGFTRARAFRPEGITYGPRFIIQPVPFNDAYARLHSADVTALPNGLFLVSAVQGPSSSDGIGPETADGWLLLVNGKEDSRVAASRVFRSDVVRDTAADVRPDGLGRVTWIAPGSPSGEALYAMDFGNSCVEQGGTCLLNGRFRVEVRWETDGGNRTGMGTAVPITSESAAFWFFRAENLELFVKVLDACERQGSYWVFLAGLTNVGVEVTVTDGITGQMNTYTSPMGMPFQPIYDTTAFFGCAAAGEP